MQRSPFRSTSAGRSALGVPLVAAACGFLVPGLGRVFTGSFALAGLWLLASWAVVGLTDAGQASALVLTIRMASAADAFMATRAQRRHRAPSPLRR